MLDISASTSNFQRAIGCAEVEFGARGLEHLYQSGCAKILLPRTFNPVPEAVLINSSGGVTGGDRLRYSASVKDGAALIVTTQAAERIYRAASGEAHITNTLKLGARTRLDWLPQETILFEGSALKRRLNVSMEESASLLAVETLMLGRHAMGEIVQNASLMDHWRVRRGGKLVFADALRFSTPMSQIRSFATLNNHRALATIVYIAPDAQDRLQQARDLLDFGHVETAASAWNGLLTLRFMADDLHPLRAALIQFLTKFRGCDLPRVWHM
jgi:urease accessory protein